MKTFTIIAKVVVALAAVAGAVYLAATYGDKIVAWAKKLLSRCPCCDCGGECTCGDEDVADVEEPAAGEAPVEEAPIEEVPVEEVVIEEGDPVAEETDFEA